MFQSNLYHELSFAQIISSHYMPSLMHIPKMMMNVVTTLQPMVEYSTHLHVLFFSTPLMLMFFSIIPLPLLAYVCIHSYVLPFPLLFFVVMNCIFYIHVVVNSKLQKQSQPPTTNKNNFQWQPRFFHELCAHCIHFLPTYRLLINA